MDDQMRLYYTRVYMYVVEVKLFQKYIQSIDFKLVIFYKNCFVNNMGSHNVSTH